MGNTDYALYYLLWARRITEQSPFPLAIDLNELDYELASLHFLRGDHGQCRSIVEELLKSEKLRNSTALRAEILAAKNARAQKAVLRAADHYNKALLNGSVNDIHRDLIYFGRGEIHFILRKFPEAEEDLLKSLDLSLNLYGAGSRAVQRRTDLLIKIYDFSKQYDKLKMLENSLKNR